jgi:hypothetical protein
MECNACKLQNFCWKAKEEISSEILRYMGDNINLLMDKQGNIVPLNVHPFYLNGHSGY